MTDEPSERDNIREIIEPFFDDEARAKIFMTMTSDKAEELKKIQARIDEFVERAKKAEAEAAKIRAETEAIRAETAKLRAEAARKKLSVAPNIKDLKFKPFFSLSSQTLYPARQVCEHKRAAVQVQEGH